MDDGWMNGGWMDDGWMVDGWMDGGWWMDGWMNGSEGGWGKWACSGSVEGTLFKPLSPLLFLTLQSSVKT